MNARDLLRHPIWQADELGHAIPDSPHAVSVALPRWQDVVGYEEKSPAVMQRLACGYPRFVIHKLVLEVARALAGDQPCLPFPSRRAAELCLSYLRRNAAEAALVARDGLHGVVTNADGGALLKAFWQHTGLIVSTRQAEAFLSGLGDEIDADLARSALRQQLAGF